MAVGCSFVLLINKFYSIPFICHFDACFYIYIYFGYLREIFSMYVTNILFSIWFPHHFKNVPISYIILEKWTNKKMSKNCIEPYT